MKLLLATSELHPFSKSGGLADMVGALPRELERLGHDVRIVCPLYGSVRRVGDWQARAVPLGVDVGPVAMWARRGSAVGAGATDWNVRWPISKDILTLLIGRPIPDLRNGPTN